jgi:hypothetical protein
MIRGCLSPILRGRGSIKTYNAPLILRLEVVALVGSKTRCLSFALYFWVLFWVSVWLWLFLGCLSWVFFSGFSGWVFLGILSCILGGALRFFVIYNITYQNIYMYIYIHIYILNNEINDSKYLFHPKWLPLSPPIHIGPAQAHLS